MTDSEWELAPSRVLEIPGMIEGERVESGDLINDKIVIRTNLRTFEFCAAELKDL